MCSKASFDFLYQYARGFQLKRNTENKFSPELNSLDNDSRALVKLPT